jgi:hypothetical protein
VHFVVKTLGQTLIQRPHPGNEGDGREANGNHGSRDDEHADGGPAPIVRPGLQRDDLVAFYANVLAVTSAEDERFIAPWRRWVAIKRAIAGLRSSCRSVGARSRRYG